MLSRTEVGKLGTLADAILLDTNQSRVQAFLKKAEESNEATRNLVRRFVNAIADAIMRSVLPLARFEIAVKLAHSYLEMADPEYRQAADALAWAVQNHILERQKRESSDRKENTILMETKDIQRMLLAEIPTTVVKYVGPSAAPALAAAPAPALPAASAAAPVPVPVPPEQAEKPPTKGTKRS